MGVALFLSRLPPRGSHVRYNELKKSGSPSKTSVVKISNIEVASTLVDPIQKRVHIRKYDAKSFKGKW